LEDNLEVLYINYILHFCSSYLHYLQFSRVIFLVMTPYLCSVFQLWQVWHNQGFLQTQYCILVSCDYCPTYRTKHWINLSCCFSTLLWRLCTNRSSPFFHHSLYVPKKTHKSEHKE